MRYAVTTVTQTLRLRIGTFFPKCTKYIMDDHVLEVVTMVERRYWYFSKKYG